MGIVKFWSILIVWFNLMLFSLTHVVKVSGKGKDDLLCLKNTNYPCKTLNFVVDNMKDFNNTTVSFDAGHYSLNKTLQLENVKGMALIGVSQNLTVISCNASVTGFNFAGFRFVRSHQLVFRNIEINGCRLNETSTSVPIQNAGMTLFTGMFFAYCKDVYFTDVIIRKNFGIGINMYDVGGTINFTRVQFIRNGYRSGAEAKCKLSPSGEKTSERVNQSAKEQEFFDNSQLAKIKSGGGLYFEYTLCGALPPFDCGNVSETEQFNHGSIIHFTQCSFSENIAEHKIQTAKPKGSHIAHGRGGGLSFFFRGTAESNTICIKESSFSENCALWGAGVYVEFGKRNQHNRFHIDGNTMFVKNAASFGGGGIRILFEYTDMNSVPYMLSIVNTTFKENAAPWGGAISIAGLHGSRQAKVDRKSRTVYLQSLEFDSNTATIGSALGLASQNIEYTLLGMGLPFVVSVNSCIFKKNKISDFGDKVIGQGTVYSKSVTIDLNNGTKFDENTYTPLVLDSAAVRVFGTVSFSRNFGLDGGGIALYGNSWIGLNENASIFFNENTVTNRGGAIFYRYSGPPRIAFNSTELSTGPCFIRYLKEPHDFHPNSWNCSVIFNNNKARAFQGKSVYATTLQNCRRVGESRHNIRSFFSKPFLYDNLNDSDNPHVVTSANKVSFDESEWKQPPGLSFFPHLDFTDELSNKVEAVFNISFWNDSTGALKSPSSLFVTRNIVKDIQLEGSVGAKFNFRFRTVSEQFVESPVGLGAIIDCPLGFYQNVEEKGCTCLANKASSGVVDCTDTHVMLFSGHWAYKGEDGLEVVSCPDNYCKCNTKSTFNSYTCILNITAQCVEGRKGLLCSQCKEGQSVVLGSEYCKRCKLTSVMTLIAGLVALSVLVLIVMYFNFDAFAGYLNAYCYSYQILHLILSKNVKLDPFIGIVVGLTGNSGTGNEFGLCILPKLNDLEKLGINYALATYTVLFTMVIGRILPDRTWNYIFLRGNILRNHARMHSFGRALAFVCVFCYSWYTRVAIAILQPVKINTTWRIYHYAHDEYFGSLLHKVLVVFAVLTILVIGIGFPIVLIFPSYFVSKYRWIQRYEVILDYLRGCFKDQENDGIERQYFAGFYFSGRLIIFLLANLFTQTIPQLIALCLLCVIILVIFCMCQPYKEWTMNFWDCLLLLNLTMINLMSLFEIIPFAATSEVKKKVCIVIQFLVYIPLVTIVLRLIAILYIKYTTSDQAKKRQQEEASIESDQDQDEENSQAETCCNAVLWPSSTEEPQRQHRLPFRVTNDDNEFHYRRLSNDA